MEENKNNEKPKRIVVDLDGCLCTQVEENYDEAVPYPHAIEVVNRLYDDGYHIIIHTARFMGRSNQDAQKAHEMGYEYTKNQLAQWGVKYHHLILGKPSSGVIIDDHAVFFRPDWVAIEQEVRKKFEKE